jgi:diphthamide biosynthesis protein 7
MTTAEAVAADLDYTEHVTTPLNACSLESLPEPVETSDGTRVWPLMLGCYQLDEAKGERRGHLDLYAVPVPNVSCEQEEGDADSVCVQGLGKPIHVMGADEQVSGVLDGKWCPRSKESTKEEPLIYATAHATGEIQIHHIQQESDVSQQFQYGVSQIGNSEPDTDGLCLALSWDFERATTDKSPLSSRKIISSYSDGKVSIHNVHFTSTSETSSDETGLSNHSLSAHLEPLESWPAHKMFHSPAEVWAACFTSQEDVVMTGGDEGQLKIWDLRAGTAKPMQTLKDTFQAGVTVLSPHPRRDHWVACGSYDETMAVLDLRSVSTSEAPTFLCHSDPLGGGMWRMKWHPTRDHRLLLGAMHGGCRVVDLMQNEEVQDQDKLHVQVHQSFTQHKSMAYGADWLVCQNLGQTRSVEAAVSCSFYDSAMYLWNVNQ